MNVKILILLSMVFCHIVDDYYLQGWLASAKQKAWWEKNSPESMYRYDYLTALFMHSFSWTFSIMLPLNLFSVLFGSTFYPMLFIVNVIVHMVTDNAKANLKKINLVQDQMIHMIQIVLTWLFVVPF